MPRPQANEATSINSSRAALLELACLLEEATRHLTLLAHDLEAYEAQRLATTNPEFAAATKNLLSRTIERAARG
jgi:hypothetical protein